MNVNWAAPDDELLPCPFCGAAPALRPHPELPEIVRVECAGDPCAVRPATEYLLARYVDELVAVWNRRTAVAVG